MVIRDIDFDYFLGDCAKMGATDADIKKAVAIRFTDKGKADKKPCNWDVKENKWVAVDTLTVTLSDGADFGRVRMGRDRTTWELLDKDQKVIWSD